MRRKKKVIKRAKDVINQLESKEQSSSDLMSEGTKKKIVLQISELIENLNGIDDGRNLSESSCSSAFHDDVKRKNRTEGEVQGLQGKKISPIQRKGDPKLEMTKSDLIFSEQESSDTGYRWSRHNNDLDVSEGSFRDIPVQNEFRCVFGNDFDSENDTFDDEDEGHAPTPVKHTSVRKETRVSSTTKTTTMMILFQMC